jgi:hypothetical protein
MKVLVTSIAPTANDVGQAYLRLKEHGTKGIFRYPRSFGYLFVFSWPPPQSQPQPQPAIHTEEEVEPPPPPPPFVCSTSSACIVTVPHDHVGDAVVYRTEK